MELSAIRANISGSAELRRVRLQGLKDLIDEEGIDPKGVRKEIVSARDPREVVKIVHSYNLATAQAWRQKMSSAPGVP